MSYKITFNIKDTHYKKIEEMTSVLIERGLKGGNSRNAIREMILNELLEKITPDFFDEILEKITPLEFLYKEGVKNPLIKEQIEKILRRNTKIQEKKQTGKKVILSEKKKLLN